MFTKNEVYFLIIVLTNIEKYSILNYPPSMFLKGKDLSEQVFFYT